MLRNYFHTLLRKSKRDLGYTGINIFGLALGIASFFFIVQYVWHELDMDTFHEDADQIFLLTADMKWNQNEDQFPSSPPALGTAITENFDDVELVTRVRSYSEGIIEIDDQLYKESTIMAVDSNFLQIFDFKLLRGDRPSVFNKKHSIVLPESYAIKYFGNEDPVNKSLTFHQEEYLVTGVIEDPPRNSHINYGPLVSIQSDGQVNYFEWSWIWHNLTTYIKLAPNGNKESVEAKIPQLIMDNASASIERITGKTVEQFFAEGNHLGYYLQPLREVYYNRNNLGPNGNKKYLHIFIAVAILILALACINYMNLSTARSLKRAKEVGIRKVLGTSRNQLIAQYVLEALIYSVVATIIAVLVGEVAVRQLSQLFDIRWDLSLFSSGSSVLFIFLCSLVIGVIAGLYPSLYLSSFQPSKVLYGQQNGQEKSMLRNMLVILQFIISFGTIIFAYTAHQQMKFLQTKDLGFEKDQLLIINNVNYTSNRNALKTEIKRLSGVNNASLSSGIPANGLFSEIFKKVYQYDQDYVFVLMEADADFVNTINVTLEEGENFNESDLTSREPHILINALARDEMELGDSAIGTRLYAMDYDRPLEISGIMENFDFFLGADDVSPMVVRPYDEGDPARSIRYLIVNVQTAVIQKLLQDMKQVWESQNKGIPFEYTFVDQLFEENFRNDTRLAQLLSIFSGIAISIALLGLIGLISFHTEQMTQTIGVRKVLGASVTSIILLITKDFARLLLIAIVVAVPVVNYFITGWQSDFVHPMPLTVAYFVIPGLSIVLLSFVLIWSHAYKAANANPVDAIRVD